MRSTVPARSKWQVSFASGGGCLIKNIHTGKYLYSTGNTISSTSYLGDVGTPNYYRAVWRMADSSWYGNTNSYEKIELPIGYKFKTLSIFTGDVKSPELFDEYNDVLWGEAENFTFSGYDTNIVNVDDTTGAFFSYTQSLYSTDVMATHKVTGRTTIFTLVINPKAVLVGVTNSGHDHISALNASLSNISSCGYGNAVYTGAFTTSDFDEYLDLNVNNIFVSRSHGGPIINASGNQVGTALLIGGVTNDIFYRSNGSILNLDLTNMKLVMFIACQTAVGGEGGLNLPTVAVSQGATTAVGFGESIGCTTANNWTRDFFELMNDGVSVQNACVQLSSKNEYSSTTMTSYIICGNKGTKLD